MTTNETIPMPIQAISPIQRQEEVTDQELARYANLIYDRTGIRVPPQKKTLLSNRVRRRLRATGMRSYSEYYDHLRRLPPKSAEWDAFLQEITTHETYLFRDENQWKWFRQSYLPQCVSEARTGNRNRSLRIWSAACSTGDEAFTAACCIADALPDHKQWQIRIVGTDIGTGAVQQAKEARFGDRAMRLVPDTYKKRYFRRSPDDGTWQAMPILTSMTTFFQHNLMDRFREPLFDIVILKNVLIYFAPESKKRVMENVRSMIRPGGLFVAGPAEGISDLVKDYTRFQSWLYQRPQQ